MAAMVTPRLFADGVQGRQLAIPSMAPHHYLREEFIHRATQEESCVGFPTIEEFLALYNDTIMDLRSEGSLVNVVSLDGTIVEQEPVECPSDDLTEFESVVYVTFNTTAEPSDAELGALARSFVESYNQANALNGETCDLSFRVVENAVVSMAADEFANGQNRKLGNGANYLYRIITSGKCRGCKPRDPLTCDGCSGRRALQSGTPAQKERPEWILGDAGLLHGSRGLQNTATFVNECYCPIGEPEERLPSSEELQNVYDDNVQFLVDEGVLTSVSSVESIVEEDKDDCDPNPCLNGGTCEDDDQWL